MASKLSMLIVDDEPSVCFTLKLIFENEGFAVTSAGSAREGIQLLQSKPKFDVVLTDLHMEKEDAGLELARQAKEMKPGPLLVVLTGYASMHNVRAALDLHVDHFAVKPMELPELLEAVRRLVGWRIDARSAGT
jgi:CheY-like chemotaxis protein